ncbi:threonine ammonia-lyase [Undibacterium luofuense]|uniref:Threonine/serine dehydratase n=1 Tax=Undibacterium luofuense TaxID=2828733 RepID=A0A941DLA7_9BURK|nr:threonine/serine dehydratase [Undibacterium luofuense]MBR7781627.1 threonine/serine dehydratase [Undibacterium luofuense]
MSEYPRLQTIQETAKRLQGKVLTTPVWQWQTGVIADQLLPQTEVWLKLELLQKTGTFKLRGALNCIEALDAEAKTRGVVAVSAGNHAIAVAYASALAGTHAKVVMLEQSSPARIAACKASGAEILLAPDVHQAFAWAKQIAEDESRTMIHPFEGQLTAQGTATVGLELMQQVPQLDAVIVPIGGGGLCAGIAAAVKQINPACAVYGVEPEGADSMSRSLRSGQPEKLEKVSTVADSLGAPFALPYSFGVCQRFVDDVVRVSDDALCQAMYFLFRDMKLVTEPATAASTAALLGPLKETLNGKKVGLIVCGANIDVSRYSELLARGQVLVEKS